MSCCLKFLASDLEISLRDSLDDLKGFEISFRDSKDLTTLFTDSALLLKNKKVKSKKIFQWKALLDYLIFDKWLDDLISHEEDDKFFSRTPILLFSSLTLEAIKLF